MKRIFVLLRAAALVLVTLMVAPASAQTVEHAEHRFSGAEKWAKIFDDPARDKWQKPTEVISALKLAPDAAVADIGSGTGYFAVRLAHAVPKGRVYGVDAEPDMVRYLGARAKREGLANIIPVIASDGGPRLPAPVDLVIVVDTYHHIPARERYFRNLQKSLKPGGSLAIIDFKLDSPVGPPKRARIEPGQVKQELKRAGYDLSQEHAFLPYQYFLVFRPVSR
jgi:SAM-dependent methyltransferase